MKIVRVTMLNDDVIEKLCMDSRVDEFILEMVTKGAKELRQGCLIVYPASMVEKVEVYDKDNPAPKLRAKRKERPAGTFGKRKRVPVRGAIDKDEGRQSDD